MKRLSLLWLCLLLSACQNYDPAELTEIPTEVKRSIHAAVDNKHRPGVVIGFVNSKGTHLYSYGVSKAGGEQPLSEQSQFAIGSLTKLFTAELYEAFEKDGVVSQSTLIADIWPTVNDHSDTRLIYLANHTAALPRDIPQDTLALNSVKKLLSTLDRKTHLPTDYSYSSVGMAILGLSLGRVTDSSFSDQLNKEILAPLKLTNTGFTPHAEILATRHQTTIPIKSPAEVPEVAYGAGGLYSTANDLVRFLKHEMQQTKHLGWKHYQDETFDAFYHGGDGNGHQAFIAFRPDNNVGVVLLSNSASDDALQDIALHLIDPRLDLPSFEHRPHQQLSEKTLSLYTGDYRLKEDESGNKIKLNVIDSRLVYHELTPEGDTVRQTPLHAIDEKTFELADMPVVISFESATNKSHAILTFEGQTFSMVRLN